jgi:hypothetical protein
VFVSGLAIAASVAAIAGTATWVVPAYIKVQNMPVESAALIGTTMGLSQVAFLVLGGYISDRMRKSVMVRAVGYAEIFGMIASFLSPWIMGLALRETGGSFTHAFLAFSALEVILVVALFLLAREPGFSKSYVAERDQVAIS